MGALSIFRHVCVFLVEQARPEGRASRKSQFELGAEPVMQETKGHPEDRVVASLSGAHRFTRLPTKEQGGDGVERSALLNTLHNTEVQGLVPYVQG